MMTLTHHSRSRLIALCTALLLLFVMGYALFETRTYLSGPQIIVENPPPGASVLNPLIEIRGIANNVSAITLNDNPIYTDEKGRFNEKVLLSQGYNVMEVIVHDRFGREKHEQIEVVLQ